MNPNIQLRKIIGAALFGAALGVSSTHAAANAVDLQRIKTVFYIAMENHNFTQPGTVTSPQQILGNPAAPYLNSLITPGNPNAAQVSYASNCYNAGVGVHPSEPNYVWHEAGSDFGFNADTDPSLGAGNLRTVPHFTAQLNAAGISWKNYQEDLTIAGGPTLSKSGTSGTATNIYFGTGQYNYAPKHNPMVFFTDTQFENLYDLSQLSSDLSNNAVGRYNWISPDQYDDAHSALTGGFTYQGTNYTGDQAAVAQGDNFLSTIVPQIMASAAYQNNGEIVIWWDETEGGDSGSFTLPSIVISPLAKGNAYASTVPVNHSSDLKTLEEIYGLSFVSNAIPANHTNFSGGFNYVSQVNDLSDMYSPSLIQSNASPADLQQLKSIFYIAMENHNFTQPGTVTSPQQILGNPAAPYLNSLITPGNPNAAQVSYAANYYNSGVGVHPSEPNYVWHEAASDFGFDADTDPSTGAGNLRTAPHFTAQLNAAGIPWKNYQEDLTIAGGPTVSKSGTSSTVTNVYFHTGQYNYAPKHNPMVFFTDTQFENLYDLTQLSSDLANNSVGRYNWISPDQYNDAHSALTGGFTYHGTNYTGDQAAIAQGDNFLSTVVPQIMASTTYQNNGEIVIWWDETEGGDSSSFTLPEIVISPLAKGNAYASTVSVNHSSDIKTLEEIYGLSFVSNAIPANHTNFSGTFNYVAQVNDLGDMYKGSSINGETILGTNGFHMTFDGTPGHGYTLLATDNLNAPKAQWTVVGGGSFSGPNEIFTDTDSGNHTNRFYVVKLQ